MKSRPSAHNADVLVIVPEGRLDALAAPALERTLAAHEQNTKHIVLNLSQTSYMSSNCLRVLVTYARRLRQAGGDLRLCHLSEKVQRVLCIAGLDVVLAIFPDEDEAVRTCLPVAQDDPAPIRARDT
ncbi:MAG: STAS domain-containing protein [Chloroflexi bacterium]|nr:STAS domain-containing protein [Chloroflexota bacterium]